MNFENNESNVLKCPYLDTNLWFLFGSLQYLKPTITISVPEITKKIMNCNRDTPIFVDLCLLMYPGLLQFT